MSKRPPKELIWEKPVPLDSYPEVSVRPLVQQMQIRLVVRTKYLAEYVSVWEDSDDDLSVMTAALASNLSSLHFRLAEPKESLAAEWVVLPAGVVNESVIRIEARFVVK